MRTTLICVNLNARTKWRELLRKELQNLRELTRITAVRVVLEHLKDMQPPFRVEMLLEVPGPGEHSRATRKIRERSLSLRGPSLRGQGSDNTLEAALQKAATSIALQLTASKVRRRARDKSQLQSSVSRVRWTHARAICRV